MRLCAAAAVVALLWSGPALAQSIGDCRGIADPQARLGCYDGLPAAEGALTPQIVPQPQLRAAPADPAFAAAQGAVKRDLDDPDAARFIGLQRRGDAVCGFVNAKRPGGGYAGSKLFVHVLPSGETHVLDAPEDSPSGRTAYEAYAAHCK
jgi:hypothetical protein